MTKYKAGEIIPFAGKKIRLLDDGGGIREHRGARLRRFENINYYVDGNNKIIAIDTHETKSIKEFSITQYECEEVE